MVHLPPRRAAPACLLDFLLERFPAVPRETWLARFAAGKVTDGEGRPLEPAEPYRAHLRVHYFREVAAEPSWPPPRILHRDEDLVVADKPPFQPVTPGGPWVRGSLLYQVAAWLEAAGEPAAELAPVHRLDRATSGLVLFSRRALTRGLYGRLFAERQVAKVYEALAELPAAPAERRWRVLSRIEAGEPFFRMRQVDGSPNAESDIELVELIGPGEAAGKWRGRFVLRPLTGKKHQLRLHLAGLGFRILGDRYYPELLPELADAEASPLCLLARSLSFRDPLSGEERCFTSRFLWGEDLPDGRIPEMGRDTP